MDADAGYIDFWSDAPTALTVQGGANVTQALSDVDIPNLLGRDVLYALAMIDILDIYDTSGALNYWNRVVSSIQVDTGAAGWLTAITTPIPMAGLRCNANQGRPGYRIIGAVDISGKVAFNATTNFQFFETRAFANNLLMAIQSGVRVFLKNP